MFYKFRTVFPSIMKSSKLHIRQKAYVKQLLQQLFDIRLLQYVQFWAPDDGRKDRPKHVMLF